MNVVRGKSFGHWGVLILGTLVFVYIVYRAICLSITHDEAFTFTRYVSSSYGDIILYNTGNILPNNHILNTICQKFYSSVFGTSEFSLRTGNVLFAFVFLFSSFQLVRTIDKKFLFASFSILVLHPYVLDFMSLSRGYGMAISLTVVSLYFYIRSIQMQFSLSFGLPGMSAAALAVWANFSWLNYFLISLVVYFALLFSLATFQDQKQKSRQIRITLAVVVLHAIVVAALIFNPMSEILNRNLLFGGERGFWIDTVSSLNERLAYDAPYKMTWMLFMQVLIFMTLIGVMVSLAKGFLRSQNHVDMVGLFVLSILFGMSAMTIIQSEFMGSYYPMERTALPFLPVFLVLFLIFLKMARNRVPGPGMILTYGSAAVFFAHTCYSANFNSVLDWKYDANTKQIVSDLQGLKGEIVLGAHPLFEPAMNFYREVKYITKFDQIHPDGYRKEGEYSHYVIPKEDVHKVSDEGLTVIKQYLPSRTILAIRTE